MWLNVLYNEKARKKPLYWNNIRGKMLSPPLLPIFLLFLEIHKYIYKDGTGSRGV